MAVIAGLESDFKTEVIANDSVLHEHDNPNEGLLEPGIVTKYIEAQCGASFSINYYFSGNFPKDNHLAVYAWLDGKLVYNQVIVAARLYDPDPEKIDGVYSQVDGHWVKQPFRFDELIIAESDGLAPNQEHVDALANKGDIVISFSFVEKAEQAENLDLNEKCELNNVGQIKEQDLKSRVRNEGTALSHQVALGEAEEVGYQYLSDVELVENSPFIMVKYKYRSLASLKKEHVIPQTPPPTPRSSTPEERDVDDLTEEEMREIIRHDRAVRDAERQRIKREHEEQDEEELRAKRQRIMDLQDENGHIVLDD